MFVVGPRAYETVRKLDAIRAARLRNIAIPASGDHSFTLTGVSRWDEKAGLQTGCCTLPSYLSTCSEAQEIKETGNEEG